MKSRRAPLRVLLDTSFILPTLGIDTGPETSEALEKLDESEAEIHYSRFNVLESLWVATRSIHDSVFDVDRFMLGLRSVMEGGRYRKVDENSEVFGEALTLYRLGHRDMIDNILYASAVRLDLRLLTLDGGLKDFLDGKGLGKTLLSPDEIA